MTVSNPTIEKLIPNWVDLYTEALEDNFRHYKVNMLTNNSARYTGSREDLSAYAEEQLEACLLYTSPSPRDRTRSRMPSSA